MRAPGVLFSHSMPLQKQGRPEIDRIVCRQQTAEYLIVNCVAIHLRSPRLPRRVGAATTFVACFGNECFPHAKRARWPGLAVMDSLVRLLALHHRDFASTDVVHRRPDRQLFLFHQFRQDR